MCVFVFVVSSLFVRSVKGLGVFVSVFVLLLYPVLVVFLFQFLSQFQYLFSFVCHCQSVCFL